MTRRAHGTLLALALGVAACTSPAAVRELSDHTLESAEALEASEVNALASFEEFVDQAEGQGNRLVALVRESQGKVLALALEGVARRIDATEAQLVAEFDRQALELLSGPFQERLTGTYRAKANEAVRKAHEDEKKKEREKDKDKIALEEWAKAAVATQELAKLAAEGEADLREQAVEKVVAARAKFAGEVRARLEPVRGQVALEREGTGAGGGIAGLVEGAGEAPPEPRISYAGVRQAIEEYRVRTAEGHEAHRRALQTIQKYLHRPSVLSLIFQGAARELGIDYEALQPIEGLVTKGVAKVVGRIETSLATEKGALGAALLAEMGALRSGLLDSVTNAAGKEE